MHNRNKPSKTHEIPVEYGDLHQQFPKATEAVLETIKNNEAGKERDALTVRDTINLLAPLEAFVNLPRKGVNAVLTDKDQLLLLVNIAESISIPRTPAQRLLRETIILIYGKKAAEALALFSEIEGTNRILRLFSLHKIPDTFLYLVQSLHGVVSDDLFAAVDKAHNDIEDIISLGLQELNQDLRRVRRLPGSRKLKHDIVPNEE